MDTATALRPVTVMLYNFVQPGDPADRQGGGVAVYQRNLVQALRAAGHRVICLSAGDRYDVFRHRPRLHFSGPQDDVAVIWNSPVFAPSHSNFYRVATYADDPGLDFAPAALRQRYGRIDVFHFQNIEGLTARFFRALRAEFPTARILLTAHNYNLVCPQVNLWFREHRVCVDYRGGRACVNCLPGGDRSAYERNIRRMREALEWLGVRRHGRLERTLRAALRAPVALRRSLARRLKRAEPPPVTPPRRDIISPERSAQYARYRRENIALAQTVFDAVLAVSQRTGEVLVSRGVPAASVHVSYIGTAHHAASLTARRIDHVGDGLHLCYLGYMRADKGFYFLLDVLDRLPERTARRMSLTIAAPITDGWAVERLRGSAHRYHAIHVYDGFSHATLPTILDGPNLGIVPALWEDNLPQVAIEMVAHGIPILTSDRGGAREIAGNDAFVFAAGNHRELARKLDAIASGALPLASFWHHEPNLRSMAQHLDELATHYGITHPFSAIASTIVAGSSSAWSQGSSVASAAGGTTPGRWRI